MGLASTGVSVLLAELADSALRAPITMARNIFFSIGLTLVYSLGLAFKRDWQTLGTVCSALSILSTVLVLAFVPESNVWKNTKNQNKSSLHLDWTHLWRSRRRPEIYKPGLFICIFFFVRQLAGTSVILTYAVSISGAAGVSVDPYIVAVGLGCGRTVAGLVAAGVSARWGRRPPVTYAGCLMSLTMIWIAHNAPEETPAPTQSPSDLYSRIAVPALLIIFVLSSTIASDIPRSMASMATSVGLCVTYMSSFVALKMYPELLSGLGRKGLFTFYAVLSVGSTVWTILLLPETHGKTLEEIEAIYTGEMFFF
ncbi:hypothetical protein AAG570_006459 [Ranatra chinensis]|uniref:Major facilitator superfamily (MFS) profile domain-containing protein n=1 Tax=Ranatra chinensis TaxID=642074 RepID=A0ABD0YU17_9HEMI